MPTHNPSRKRGMWRVRPRIKIKVVEKVVEKNVEKNVTEACLLEAEETTRSAIQKKLSEIAPLLWSDNYDDIKKREQEELSATGILLKSLELKASAPPSTYTSRNMRMQSAAASHVQRQIRQASDAAAAALRQANQQIYPFSICARSVATLMHRMNTKDWFALQQKKEILSKTTTIKLVKLMMECRPAPPFTSMQPFCLHVFDQCFKKKGASRGKHRAAEQVYASGDLVDLVSMVIVNSVTIPVPARLAGGIDMQLANELHTTGPYTRPFTNIIPLLEPDRVKALSYKLMKETGSWIQATSDKFGFASVSDMMTAHMARACIGRPRVAGGRAYVNINPPVLNCDTKSLTDGIRIVSFLESLTSEEQQIVMGLLSDGQSMMTLCYLKRHHPERYRHVLIICGCFHAFGHFMFGGHESYFDCFTGYFATKLHKEKVPKVIMNFENDSYMHVLAHLCELSIGGLAFIIHDCVNPPPELFLSNPAMYESLILHSGGTVLFKYLQNVGIPVLHYLLAGRKADGQKNEDLQCMAYHLFRAGTHKVNCVMITILSLLSTCATHPTISEIVKACLAFSPTGKEGSLMYGDRYLEHLNNVQGERDGKFAAFETGIHYTEDLTAMIHVEQMWEISQRGQSPLHDPVSQSTLNAAEIVRKDLLDKLGTDLTVADD